METAYTNRDQRILFMKLGVFCIACSLLLAALGCNSIRTTVLDRSEDDRLQKNRPTTSLKGIPVMLKVPTHMEITVYERSFFYQTKQSNRLVAVDCNEMPTRFVKTNVAKTEKMFLVDPKRAAAGITEYGFKFQGGEEGKSAAGHGYLSQANYKVQDETLTQAASLVNSVAAALLTSPGTPGADPKSVMEAENGDAVPVHEIDRVVAFCRFDINSPTYDEDVRQFLNQYLNHCQSCQNLPQYGTPKADCKPKANADSKSKKG